MSGPSRRTALLGGAAVASGWAARPAFAQAVAPAPNRGSPPREGTHYVRLPQPLAAATPGRLEVIEFFWYGCPHCNSFEPALEPWSQKLGADVAFRRVPVWFTERPFAAHQRLYYALEATRQLATLHRRAFYAIHSERQPLADAESQAAFVARHGGDAEAFKTAWDSFGVQTRVQQARTLAAAYKVESVPSMGVAGRWTTTGALAAADGQATAPGSNERVLVVVDHLLERLRRGE